MKSCKVKNIVFQGTNFGGLLKDDVGFILGSRTGRRDTR